MKYLSSLMAALLLSSCVTKYVVNDSDSDEKPIDIVEAVIIDAKIATAVAEEVAKEIGGITKPTSEPKHLGNIDAECNDGFEEKICSANRGCWCENDY